MACQKDGVKAKLFTLLTIETLINLKTKPGLCTLMRMPCAAATPEPTMTAVGVASPSAQGQAMTRVEIPNSRANRKALLPAGYHSAGIMCLLPVEEDRVNCCHFNSNSSCRI